MNRLFATLLASNAAIWYIRFRYGDQGAENELFLLTGLFVLLYRHALLRWLLYSVSANSVSILVWSAALGFVASIYGIWKVTDLNHIHANSGAASQRNGSAQLLEPLIFPCRTTHTRLFPKKHSFSYSYLYVGIPVGWRGSVRTLLSADIEALSCANDDHVGRPRREKRAWLSVEATDYLNRGGAHLGLQGKLHEYLVSQAR